MGTCGQAFQAEGTASARAVGLEGRLIVKLQRGLQLPIDIQLSNRKNKNKKTLKKNLLKVQFENFRSVRVPNFMQ